MGFTVFQCCTEKSWEAQPRDEANRYSCFIYMYVQAGVYDEPISSFFRNVDTRYNGDIVLRLEIAV